jgi:phospholipid/cholesterol/gamma-HCH transport system substrate-binding protein/paraquat-inducible protein B
MSQKANYFKIGAFVIVAAVLVLAAVVLFGSGVFAPEKQYFETYFNGSVSGLTVGAPVENRGVRIGRVEKITFAIAEYGDDLPLGSEDFYNYQDYVVVVASVDKTNIHAVTPEEGRSILKRFIARGLRLQLASNILTGQAYLEADYLDPRRYPVIEVPWEPKNVYVPSAPGALSTLKSSVDRILSRLEQIETDKIGRLIEEILVSLNRAIDDANVGEISRGVRDLVAGADRVVDEADIPRLSNELYGLFAEARETNQRLKRLIASEKPKSQTANLAEVIAQLNTTLRRIDKLVASQTPQIERALESLREVSRNLEELTESLKKHPSELIFSQPPPESEVPK